MNLYLNYAREHWRNPYENPPIGLILCSEHNAAVAHYSLGNLEKLLLHAGDAMRSTLTHLRDVLDDWERDVERD